ncbi:MAG: signal peptidase I [Thermoplasmata archaeon]
MPGAGSEAASRAPLGHRAWRWLWKSQHVVVHDGSMSPTLEPGDRLLVDDRVYLTRPPRPGEIVVLVDPQEPERWLIKRVAGVGPTRLWRTLDGVVEGSVAPNGTREAPAEAVEAIDVPPAFVYVTGDALESSRDSRQFGAVPLGNLVGRAYRCYTPRERQRDL